MHANDHKFDENREVMILMKMAMITGRTWWWDDDGRSSHGSGVGWFDEERRKKKEIRWKKGNRKKK